MNFWWNSVYKTTGIFLLIVTDVVHISDEDDLWMAVWPAGHGSTSVPAHVSLKHCAGKQQNVTMTLCVMLAHVYHCDRLKFPCVIYLTDSITVISKVLIICPFNVFILLNGWMCMYSVLTKPALSRFSNALKIIAISFFFLSRLGTVSYTHLTLPTIYSV